MGNQRRKAELERQRAARRRTIAGIVVVVILVGVTGGYLLLTRDDAVPSVNDHGGPNFAAEFEGGPPTLVYADFDAGRDLHTMDLPSETDEVVGQLPRAGNTIAAPGSTWMTIDVAEDGDDGTVQPVIYAFDSASEEEIQLGVGLDPVWSPDGSKVAWARAEDPADCGGSRCSGDMIITVTDPETEEPTEFGDPGPYSITGWAGDYLIVQKDVPGETPVVESVSPDGDFIDLPLRPIEFWGASPDGRYIVQNGETGARFLEFEDGDIAGPGPEIGIASGTKLGAGQWANDSSAIAAFALGDDGLEFVTLSPGSPEPVTLADGGEASTGKSLWTPDNDGVVFQRFNGTELEAVYCPLESPGECSTVLTWTKGLELLRVE
ncbi:MAG: hypothetical protein QOG04_525 [Actinomycetota bacterium]|nr:hypothetical protein [Actinomycetota bacterium]